MFFSRKANQFVGLQCELFRRISLPRCFQLHQRFKSNSINGKVHFLGESVFSTTTVVSNYETGFNAPKSHKGKSSNSANAAEASSLVDELDLLSLSFKPDRLGNESSMAADEDASLDTSPNASTSSAHASSNPRRINRSLVGKYPTGGVAKLRCYNCGQMGHVSFDCSQPQVRKACYNCGNSGHLARDCPVSQRPIICYVCRQPGHQASKCPNSSSGQFNSKNRNNDNNLNDADSSADHK